MTNARLQALRPRSTLLCCLCVICIALIGSGCDGADQPRVVVYTSVDQPYAKPIIDEFEKQTGIRVTLVTDSEAGKTVGLAERVRAERSNPQADVYWGNEPFHTINLAAEGLLAPYESPSAADVLAMYRDPEHRWTGNALRARVLVALSDGTSSEVPSGIEELAQPAWKDRTAIARPTAGTTGGHVAAIYVLWGEERADAFFRALHANGMKVLGGNAVVADSTARGVIRAGFTDNDDVSAALQHVVPGAELRQILPDQDSFGTLMVPTTVGLVEGAPNPDQARQLIDFLLTADVERRLIEDKFAGWSVRSDAEVKAMDVDLREVARVMPHAVRRATAILEGRE